MKEYYGGGSGSDPSPTDCFESAFDHYMLTLAGQSTTACTTGLGVVSSYDASHSGSGNTPEDGGVNGSNYEDVMNYGANLNGFTAVTRSACAIVDHWTTPGSGSGSGSNINEIRLNGIGAFNDSNGTDSHAVNVTRLYKAEDGQWYAEYKDYQSVSDGSEPQQKEILASQMIDVTMFDPIDSGSGSGSGN